ncbi:MAG TPA: bifunctional diguanylate cyclase/phosphodiesterase [Candidatus Dormibacteraeota bacterium]|nr:bifunctional diguanylate cyclase/phosphodiesterase [Candidatus Dormibacteraeota bacterium]
MWKLVAALLAVTGVLGSVVAAGSASRSDAEKSHQAFVQASGEVASNVRLALQREQDLVVSGAAFVLENQQASNAGFKRWMTDVQVLERHPELSGMGVLAFVPRPQLHAFEARARADGTGALGPGGTLAIVPAGIRPYYCFITWSGGRLRVNPIPTGVDLCATAPRLIDSRGSGQGYDSAISLPQLGKTPVLLVETPFYRGGGVPTMVAQRRTAFVGWIGILIAPEVLLDSALHGHPGLAVVLRDTTRSGVLAFTAGHLGARAESTTIDLRNGSTVQISAVAASAGLFARGNALEILIAGTCLSVLLGLLVFVLGSGRARAVRMVSEKTRQLSFQAMHDKLTELPNRALVFDRAEHMLARAKRRHSPIATMFIDVDGFKQINDTFGHAAGDQFLQIIATRLSAVVRASDTVGRLGGDEFVVLLEGEPLGEPRSAEPEMVAERLLEVLRQPFELEGASGRPQVCSVSIGIAVGERASADELLRDADLALYQAKQAGKNRYVLFEDSMQIALASRVALESDLVDALAAEEFYLLYQPTFDLQSQAVTGVEALIHWRHPTRGVVAPDLLIPLAEQNAMIVPIGCWVLQQACLQAAAWHAEGHHIGMSVNVSGRQLERDAFIEEDQDAPQTSGLEPEALTLEITETVLMRDAEAAASRLRALKALGVRLAIDDFGTGYSSLAYLHQFPVDALKIDRSFMSGISSSTEAAALLHTLVGLGKALGLETLGEGVEEQAQLEQLQREECDSGQGFLYARPLDVEAITKFLERSSITV